MIDEAARMDLMKRQIVPANTSGSRTIVTICYLFGALSIVLVTLRFVARKVQRLPIALDDWLILASLPVLLAHNAIVAASVYLGGIGHHENTLGAGNHVAIYKCLTVVQFTFGISLGLIKASIVCFLMRIFSTPRVRLAAKIILVYVACWVLVGILVGSAMCRPFQKNWDPTIPGKCGDRMASYIVIAVMDIIGDIMIVVLPMTNIWRLHTGLKMKVGLSVIFAISFLDVIVGILRVVYLVQWTHAEDFTYSATGTWVWSTLEPSLAVFVACLPTLKPLYRSLKGKSFNSRSFSSSGQAYQNFSNPKNLSASEDNKSNSVNALSHHYELGDRILGRAWRSSTKITTTTEHSPGNSNGGTPPNEREFPSRSHTTKISTIEVDGSSTQSEDNNHNHNNNHTTVSPPGPREIRVDREVIVERIGYDRTSRSDEIDSPAETIKPGNIV